VDKYAILIDGPFAIKVLASNFRRFPAVRDVRGLVDQIDCDPHVSNLRLLRSYFHHALPASGRVTNPLDGNMIDLGATQVHRDHTAMIRGLELATGFAIRLGEVSVGGWKRGHRASQRTRDLQSRGLQPDDIVPDITQKGVDLRIGLDIARLALTGRVTAIVVVTGDSDFVPAFKFARREGIQVFLDSLGRPTKRELRIHADGEIENARATSTE